MTEYIDRLIRETHEDIVAQREAYLLSFFGSYENAKEFGKYFVLEETELKTLPEGIFDVRENDYKISFHTEVRIRLKTPEELTEDGLTGITAADIIKINEGRHNG